ncbi:MAG: hypothetical protein MZV64_59385 [Ignavibacteriales bacterium]|nr:hypothetical protein [Ignavibacteriales bacterium]
MDRVTDNGESRHCPGEIDDARHKGDQHVEQGAPGSWVGIDRKRTPSRLRPLFFTRQRWGREPFHIFIGGRDLIGRDHTVR